MVAALLHFGIVGYIVYAIFAFGEPDWPMYWLLMGYIDVAGALLWLATAGITGLIYWNHPDYRRSPSPGLSLSESLRRIPMHIWLSAAALAPAAVLQVASLSGAQLGNATNRPNFIGPLALFSTLGTLIWSDLARRLVGAFTRREQPGTPGS